MRNQMRLMKKGSIQDTSAGKKQRREQKQRCCQELERLRRVDFLQMGQIKATKRSQCKTRRKYKANINTYMLERRTRKQGKEENERKKER